MTPTNTPEAARLAEEAKRLVSAYGASCELGYIARIEPSWQAACAAIDALAAPTSASTVPAGFWLAPMEPDEDLCEAIADVKRRRLLRAIEAARVDDEINPRGLVPACGEEFRAARDHYLARNPGACSVTDGEAKK